MTLPLCGWVASHAGITVEPDGPPPDIGLALRTAGARPHLLVSTVLGRHIPVAPSTAVGAASELVDAVAVTSPHVGLVVGFAETATALSAIVARAVSAPWLHTTRVAADTGTAVIEVDESHSHATRHWLCPADSALLRRAGTVVLVDDELSTGATAMKLVRELDRFCGGRRYVLATLLDTRPASAQEALAALADELGCRIDVVARRRATVRRGSDALLPDTPAVPAGGAPIEPHGRGDVRWLDGVWPAGLPSGGRNGATQPAVVWTTAVDRLAERVAQALRSSGWDLARGVHVLGTEEFSAVPLAVARRLEGVLAAPVVFSSTTRSPVRVVDDPNYPVRRALRFHAFERGCAGDRFAYNVGDGRVVVLVVDETCDPAALRVPGGAVAALAAQCPAVLVVRVAGTPPPPPTLFGPAFSSYHRRDVEWLLTDVSDRVAERGIAEREAAVQAGREHYSQSLPVEYVPSDGYVSLFHELLTVQATDVAHAVGVLAERLVAGLGRDLTLVSLARAGVPAAILVRRWIRAEHGSDVPHLALSIIRDRGIDSVALARVLERYDPSSVVFVDGWTGKGAIADELAVSLPAGAGLPAARLAVIADPGRRAAWHGTRDDLLVPSACLNATVSGLVSRTMLDDRLVRDGAMHGAKYYGGMAGDDLSGVFLSAITEAMGGVRERVARTVAAAPECEPPEPAWAVSAVQQLCYRYGVSDERLVKPGIGEATRVLLRRVPRLVVVRDAVDPQTRHLVHLARERGVPVDVVDDLPYRAVGLVGAVRPAGP